MVTYRQLKAVEMRLVLLIIVTLDEGLVKRASFHKPGLDLELLEAEIQVALLAGERVADETFHMVLGHEEIFWMLLLQYINFL